MNYKDCLIDLTTMIEITFAQTKTTHAVTSALYEIQYKLKSILNSQLIVFFFNVKPKKMAHNSVDVIQALHRCY